MEFGPVTVVQDGGKVGAMAAPGLDHVYDPDHAQKQIYAFSAGYAAMIAAGYDEKQAMEGAWSDFDAVEILIERWGFSRTVEEWKAEVMEMMRELRNVQAVSKLAIELMEVGTMEWDTAGLCIDAADGLLSEEEFRQSMAGW